VRWFTPELFDFLFDLDVDNDKAWFDANRDRYEQHVRQPMLRFIAGAADPLKRVSPHLVADPRPNGGSLFRIHRNRRFHPDAPPYKTNAGAQFRHERARDAHAPMLYLHLEPGNCFMGAGIWRPDGPTLTAIRTAIVEKRGAWTKVRKAVEASALTLGGESLKTAPRGFERDDPHIEDLRRKSFVARRSFDEDRATSDGFLDWYIDQAASVRPLLAFLCRAVDVPF
jgi:uncharacterized protein (TIGR02453 family)